jgi:hypothetical protein
MALDICGKGEFTMTFRIAVACVLAGSGFVYADEFYATISKVDGQKIFVVREAKGKDGADKEKSGRQPEDILFASNAIKVFRPKVERNQKVVSGEELFGGLENEEFQERVRKGGYFWLTTDNSNRVLEIRFFGSNSTKRPETIRPAMISDLSQKDSQAYDYVLAGIRENREKMKSGMFRASGHQSMPSSEAPFELKLYCAFDWPSGRLRFNGSRELPPNQSRQPKVREKKAVDEAKEPMKVENVVQKSGVVFTPKEVIEFTGKTIRSFSPDQNEEVKGIKRRAFDIRALGMYGHVDFLEGIWFEDTWKRYKDRKPRDIQRDADGTWKINWEVKKPALLETLWLEETKGFSVTRHEIRGKDKVDKLKWAEPMITSHVTWTLYESVWVPKTFVLQTRVGVEKFMKFVFAIEWESLNTVIPDKVFTVDDFEISKRTAFLDMKTGHPIVVDVLNTEVKGRSVATKTEVYDSVSPFVWMFFMNIALVAFILVCVRYKREY